METDCEIERGLLAGFSFQRRRAPAGDQCSIWMTKPLTLLRIDVSETVPMRNPTEAKTIDYSADLHRLQSAFTVTFTTRFPS